MESLREWTLDNNRIIMNKNIDTFFYSLFCKYHPSLLTQNRISQYSEDILNFDVSELI